MTNSYQKLKSITDACYLGKRNKFSADVIMLLENEGIKLREKDGIAKEVNISIPKTIKNAIVIGVRYVKKDKTYTEDHFLFQEGQCIKPCYKGQLEKILPEYKGTHKKQI